MTLIDQLEVVNCDSADQSGTGTGRKACPFDWDRVEAIELSDVSYRYTEEQTLASVQLAQQKGEVIIIKGIKSFTLSPLDPNISTAEGSGFETVTGEMPYKYTMISDGGVNLWKAYRKFNSKDRYNVKLYDAQGNTVMTETKGGDVKGFGLKMLHTGQYKGREGSNPAEYTTMLQFADLKEMDRMTWITAENLDYDANSDLDGINDIDITINPVAAAATEIVIKPFLNDKSHILLGTSVTDWRVKKNGVVIVPSGIATDENAKTVTFTVPATAGAEVYTVETYDTVAVSNVVNLLGVLYRGLPATVVVV